MNVRLLDCGQVTIDHDAHFIDLINAAHIGNVDRELDFRTFKPRPAGQGTEVVHTQFAIADVGTSDGYVEKVMRGNGHFLGSVQLLLSVSARFPMTITDIPLVALGTTKKFDKYTRVPFIITLQGVRHLRWGYRGDEWPRGVRYLVYQKVPSAV